ncbi:hypothetical protein L1F06_008910 [Ectopseudomonas hydrolytica]|uniref:Sulfotransferase family protein n=1 Tax=Ectopseudomonas hydrolytica TaxID=2493633 RepID=A0ABY5AC86_9GAMM|nr:hypothetical protein [Pseudomonas hydrolytica]USR41527.1 hypothetical protein L1F06_008910 [Pseudomonas hydrolytica]
MTMFFRNSHKKKIILHIGLPKTGSTALQQAFYQSREVLLRQGVLYPAQVYRQDDPKHNFVLDLVRKGQGYDIGSERGYKAASRIVLSNEALSNDFYFHGLERNRQLAELLRAHGELEICMVLRRESEWLRSYYKQAVINQPVKGKPHYQNSLPLAAFRELEPVRRLLDQGELIQDVSAAFQAPVRVMRYEEVPVRQLLEYCTELPGITYSLERRHNESVSDAAVEVMRQLNAQIETLEEKYSWSYLLVQACGACHDVLNTLAGRATPNGLTALEGKKLADLRHDHKVTPGVREEEFNAIVSGLRQQLAALKDK